MENLFQLFKNYYSRSSNLTKFMINVVAGMFIGFVILMFTTILIKI